MYVYIYICNKTDHHIISTEYAYETINHDLDFTLLKHTCINHVDEGSYRTEKQTQLQ